MGCCVLPCVAACCSVLQIKTIKTSRFRFDAQLCLVLESLFAPLRRVAVCCSGCSVLNCVTVMLLQVSVCYTDIHIQTYIYRHLESQLAQKSLLHCCSVLQCVAVCCSVLQCVAVCCSVLKCVAECCSVSQCVAECCSVAPGERVLHLQLAHESLLLAQVTTRP